MDGKKAADVLTGSRGLIALALAWVGLIRGADGLVLAAWLLLLAWATDALDGPLARHSRRRYRTWLGDHDLHIDMAVAAGLLIYLVGAGFTVPLTAILYIMVWAVVFARWGLNRSLGMLVQAPVYGRFLWLCLQRAPDVGRTLVGWLLLLVLATWPRFPREVIPGFLDGLRALGHHGPPHQGQNGTSNNLRHS